MRLTLCMVLLVAVLSSGCADANKLNKIRIGMTKGEVVAVLGDPLSVSAQGKAEYLNYRFSETDEDASNGVTKPYYVRLMDGNVESYGKLGDFDSTKDPTIAVKTEDRVTANIRTDTRPDLYSELQKLKSLRGEGTITEEEYQALKKKLIEAR